MANDLALAVRDIRKSFGPLEVLRGVSLEARRGDVISLIGQSGSGKSTLLRCINYLETPDSGEIIVGDEVIRARPVKGKMPRADRRQLELVRQRLGMVFQNFNLWAHMTVLANIIEAPVHVLGLPRDQAHRLAVGTFAGASELARRSKEPPAVLRERVTSKGGTTYAALQSLEQSGVQQHFMRALQAARQRAHELGDEFGSA